MDRRVLAEARAIFRRRQKQKDADKALTSAWNKLTNDSPELVGFLSSITKHRYDEDMVRQFLDGLQEPLVKPVPVSGCSNPVPQYITFQVEGEEAYGPAKVKQSAWRYVLDDVCRLMRERHPDTFDHILEIQGFAKSGENLKSPIEMASVGLYFAYPAGHAAGYRQACADVLAKFGYPRSCLTVRVKGGMEVPL